MLEACFFLTNIHLWNWVQSVMVHNRNSTYRLVHRTGSNVLAFCNKYSTYRLVHRTGSNVLAFCNKDSTYRLVHRSWPNVLAFCNKDSTYRLVHRSGPDVLVFHYRNTGSNVFLLEMVLMLVVLGSLLQAHFVFQVK